MAKFSIMTVLMVFAAIAMLLDMAVAVDYDVGTPNGGWDTSTDLGSWASSNTFRVGDNIVFQYGPSHDVLEVNSADYASCNIGNPISSSTTSPTTVPLTAAGSRYFICGRSTHCSQGMKVQINAVAATGPSPPQSTTPSVPSTPTNGPTTNSPSPPPPRSETVNPPSSAITLKMSVGSILGFGILMVMLLSF